jgi:conjugative transfer signal peptidase TraF
VTRRHHRTSDAPLLAWGESVLAARPRSSAFDRYLLVAGAAAGILFLSIVAPPAPLLVWNVSASAPIGLYLVSPGAWPEPGDMAIARVPERYRKLAADRHYLPTNVSLVKRIAAYGGDKVCSVGSRIFINGRSVAKRELRDAKGRPMPKWSGCIRLHGREVFLLMDNPASFDGRYFGVTKGADIVGKARLLWRR